LPAARESTTGENNQSERRSECVCEPLLFSSPPSGFADRAPTSMVQPLTLSTQRPILGLRQCGQAAKHEQDGRRIALVKSVDIFEGD